MSVFYLVLSVLGVLGLVVVFLGLLKREPGENPWKLVLGGAAALFAIILSSFLLFKRKDSKRGLEPYFEPPEKTSPTKEEREELDRATEKLVQESEEMKKKARELDLRREELNAKKEELDRKVEASNEKLEKFKATGDTSANGSDPDVDEFFRNRG